MGIETKKTISVETARIWLHNLGWDYKDHSKNIYFDGHERDDVVTYRNQFINQMINLRPRFTVYEGEDMEKIIPPILSPNICELVPVTHNESIFYANDGVIKT